MLSQPIQAVIFDMDGLMFATEDVYRAAWQQAAADQGFVLSDELYARFVGRTNAAAEALLVAEFGSGFLVPAFQQAWPRYWHAYVERHGLQQKPGLIELLELLEQCGLPKAVATSASRTETEVCLRDLRGRFVCVVTADDVQHGKPAPDLFLAAARQLDAAPGGCLVLEDSAAGVLAAAAARMPVLLVPDLQQPTPEVAARALRVCRSLHEVVALLQQPA